MKKLITIFTETFLNATHNFNFKNAIALFILFFAFAANTLAQTPQYYNYNTLTNSNAFPFNVSTGKQVQWLVAPGEFNQPSGAPAGNITSIFVFMVSAGTATYNTFTIKLGQTSATTLPTGVMYTGALSTVYSRSSIAFTTTASGWLQITLDSTFAYNPAQSLVIDISHCGFTGTSSNVYQTSIANFRRTYATPTSCVFAYGGQDALVGNLGLNITCTSNMTYASSNTLQILNGANVLQNSVNNQILQVPVVTGGGCLSPISLNRLVFNTAGTTNPASDITQAKVYYTGGSSIFSTTTQYGSTFVGPNGAFTVTGSQTLLGGTNYFWLVYDVPLAGPIGDLLDARCDSVVADDTARIPTINAPAGFRQIDNYARGTFSNAGSCCNLYISNVTFEGINNTTGFDPDANFPYAYKWYTSPIPNIEQGSTYPISISEPGSSNPNGFAVWIDWNNNNLFTDGGEYYAIGLLPSGGVTTVTNNIVVPPGAALGNHRMRVRSNFNAIPTAIQDAAVLLYGETEDYLVNVVLATSMTYSSSTTNQTNVSTVFAPANGVQMIGVQVVMTGTLSPQSITSFTLNTTGSTNPATDISKAKLWYTGTNSGFAMINQFGNTYVSPSGAFTIIGSQQLAQGTNYFWLTYDIPSGAVLGDSLDAECNSITVASIVRTPTIQAPAGFRLIGGTRMAGVYTIPGTYANFNTAITDLNSRGTSGPVTFIVADGFVDTAANLVITTSGTAANPVIFKKSSSEPRAVNPVIIAGVGTSTTTDGIIKLSGADYITFDGIDLQENPANVTSTTQMEWGYALVKPDGTNGCQNVIIKSCTITLNKSNLASVGIYSHNHSPISTATFIVSSTAGANSNNTFLNNTISNSYIGIYINGYADASPFTFYDQSNSVNGNTITNYGGAANTAYGVYNIYQNGLNISNNIINSSGGVNSTATLYGIFCSTMSNSDLTISNNTVTVISASTTSSVYGINFGNGSAGTSNNINILNNTVTGCDYPTATSGILYHIYCNATCNNLTVSGNRVIGNNYGGGASTGQAYYIYNLNGATTSITITNNLDSGNVVNGTTSYALYHISNQVATFNATITGNRVKNNVITGTTSTATCYGIINSAGTFTCNYSNNTVSNNNIASTSSTAHYCMYNSTPAPASDYTNNTVSGNTSNGTGILYSLAYLGAPGLGSVVNINNNTVTNQQKLTVTGTGTIYGIYQSGSGTGTYNINNNTITGLTSAAASPIYGIYQIGSPANYVNINNNRIGNLSNAGVASIWGINNFPTSTTRNVISGDSVFNITSLGGTLYGIYINSGFTWDIFKNKISGIYSNTGTAGVVYGFYSIAAVAGATVNFYDNFISDLRAPASTSTAPAVSGINIAGGAATTVNNIFYNTVLLKDSSTSATTFSTAGIYALTTPIVDLRNNVVVNLSYPGTSGSNTVAYRRSSNILTTYSNNSNNNCFYAGTPSATNLIYYDVTNSDQTLAAYKTRVIPRDNNSATENPPFVNSAAPPFDLRIQTAVPTQLESGAKIVSSPFSITNDIYNTNRYPNGGYPIGGFTPVAPDMGAYEFGGLNTDNVPPSISYTPLGNGGTSNRTFNNVIITDASGVNTTAGTRPRCYYKRSIDSNVVNDTTNTTDGWKYVEATGTTSPFTFIIDYSKLVGGTGVTAGQVIQYFVIAQDLATSSNVGYNQAVFAIAPVSVNLVSSNAPITTTLSYTIVTDVFTGSYNVGTAQTYTSLTGAGGLFASINAGVVSGDITAVITSDLVEDGTNALNIFNETGAGGYRLRIIPSDATLKTISGAVAQGMIRFNGSRRVTIDGGSFFTEQNRKISLNGDLLVPGKYLTFRNTNGTNPTFTFINDAVGDSIKYCNIESNNAGTASGTIVFSTTTGTQGNDSNVIAFCDIRDRSDLAGTPANGIYSLGTTTAIPYFNSNNVITNCNIYNNYTDIAATMAGILMTSGTTDWVITNNSFYQTATRNYTTSATVVGVYNAATTAMNHQVIGNYFGGTAPLCGGSPMTYTGAGLYTYNGIQLLVGGIFPSSIQGNTIQNINLTTSPATGSSVFFRGITVPTTVAYCNIGNITGNTVGAPAGNGSITLNINTTTTAYISLAGIFSNGIGTINNNSIGSITVTGNSAKISSSQLFLLQWSSTIPGWIYNCTNNLIGSLSTPNSILYTDSLSPCQVRPIFFQNAAGTINNITNNTVANITNNTPVTTANTAASLIYAISASTTGNYNISNNNIFNLTLNTNTILATTFLLEAVSHSSTGINNINQNTVSSLYYNATGTGVGLNAAMFIGGATGSTISRNKINDSRYSGTATTTSPLITGIFVANATPGTITVSNNMVALTNGDPTDIPFSKTQAALNLKHDIVGKIPITEQSVPLEIILKNNKPIIGYDPDSKITIPEPNVCENVTTNNNSSKNNLETKQEVSSANSASIVGIITQSGSVAPTNFYYNTVYVGGTQPGGSAYGSWAFLKQLTGSLILRNNLFVNNRSGGTANHYAIGNENTNPAQGWNATASNYNVYLGINASTIGEWGVSNPQTITQWVASSLGDKQTWSTTTSTINPQNLITNIGTGDLTILPGNTEAWLVSGKGIALSGVNVDYTGESRVTAITGGCTDIGADEFTGTPPSNPGATQVGTPAGGNTTSYTLWGRTLCSIDWGVGGTSYPTTMTVNYFSGINPSPAITSPNRNSNSNWTVVPTGNLAGTTYTITLFFGDNETYNITSPNTNTLLAKYGTFWQVFPAGNGADQFSNLDWNNLTVSTGGLNTFSTFALSDAALPSIVLVSPTNNSIVSSSSTTLVWNRAAGSTSHRVVLATDSTFASGIIKDTTTADTTKAISALINNTSYFWRVYGTNGIGTGAYSQIFKFTYTQALSPPPPPVLFSPPDNAIGQPLSLTLVWFKSVTASSYRVQVSTDSLFSSFFVNDSTIIDSTRLISGLTPLTNYWWRVNAKNGAGTSAFSTVFKFRTMGPPTVVTLLNPPNNATNQPTTINFRWSRSQDQTSPFANRKSNLNLPLNNKIKNGGLGEDPETISNYWFELTTDTNTFANLNRDTTLTDTNKTVSGLSNLTVYFWRVKAKNQVGYGNFSVWFRFTTAPLPPALLTLTVIPGGFYNTGSGTLNMRDTIKALLIDSTNCLRIDSARGVIDSVTFSANISFSNANTGNYYLYIFHRNHVFISARYKQNIVRGSTVSYDFTTDSAKAYGFNMIKVATGPDRWGMIPGDANQDGFVDGLDQTIWIAQNGLDGYWSSDFNGDLFVDGLDQTIWIFMNGQSYFVPCELTFENITDHAKKTGSIYNRQIEGIMIPKPNNR